MLYLLCVITFAFVILNFKLNKKDWMAPAVIFSAVFFLYTFGCVIEKNAYDIVFIPMTVFVISAGTAVFTLVTWAIERSAGETAVVRNPQPIEFHNAYVVLLIIAQLLSIIFFIKYLGNLADAYSAVSGETYAGLGAKIELYDTMTKFWKDTYAQLAVSIPMIYRLTNPLCGAAEYLLLYIGVHNFTVNKKINPLYVVSVGLMIVRIVINGSRSPILRIITFAFCLLYVFYMRQGKQWRMNGRLIGIMAVSAAVLCVLMIALLFAMGRGEKGFDLFGYIFTYFGAPVVNLDTFLRNNDITFLHGVSDIPIFAAHILRGLYIYIDKILGTNFFPISEIDFFAFSRNGIEIGNVYTMFYKIIYDLGISGVIWVTGIMALYYSLTYKKVRMKISPHPIDFRLFIYAYLFNDLIMSTFSNRYYETVFDAPFIKFVPVALVLDKLIIEYHVPERMLQGFTDRIRKKKSVGK